MKIIKVEKNYNFFNNRKGMAMLQFLLMTLAVFMLLVVFVELGFYLRSEAIAVQAAHSAVRSVEVNGMMTQSEYNKILHKLSDVGITPDLQDPIKIIPLTSTGALSPIGVGNNSLKFRQSFQVRVKGWHKFGPKHDILIPVAYTTEGKVERFKREN